jgi:hypothetical protein
MHAMREMMGRLKLTVNEEKTRLCRVPESSFDFLGYTFGRCYSAKMGRSYIGTRPSKKSIAKVRRTISELTSRRWLLIDSDLQVAKLNRALILLRHKLRRERAVFAAAQEGQRESVAMRSTTSRRRSVAIELGTWRSGRSGGASGSITLG